MNNRNQPCHCGSNKKFKRCCGNMAERARKNQEAWKRVVQPEETQANTTSEPASSPVAPRYRRQMPSLALIAMAAIAMGGLPPSRK